MSGNTKSGNKRGERFENYGNIHFKGNGTIRCQVCGGKLRDHPMRPCDGLGVRVLHTDKKPRSTRANVAKSISSD
jgi:hypothetical protein